MEKVLKTLSDNKAQPTHLHAVQAMGLSKPLAVLFPHLSGLKRQRQKDPYLASGQLCTDMSRRPQIAENHVAPELRKPIPHSLRVKQSAIWIPKDPQLRFGATPVPICLERTRLPLYPLGILVYIIKEVCFSPGITDSSVVCWA
eukprot:scaffold21271_cov42-Prasinocladus_malaysianus.AAC.1